MKTMLIILLLSIIVVGVAVTMLLGVSILMWYLKVAIGIVIFVGCIWLFNRT